MSSNRQCRHGKLCLGHIRAMEKCRVGWRELDLEAEIRHEFIKAPVRKRLRTTASSPQAPMPVACTIAPV